MVLEAYTLTRRARSVSSACLRASGPASNLRWKVARYFRGTWVAANQNWSEVDFSRRHSGRALLPCGPVEVVRPCWSVNICGWVDSRIECAFRPTIQPPGFRRRQPGRNPQVQSASFTKPHELARPLPSGCASHDARALHRLTARSTL